MVWVSLVSSVICDGQVEEVHIALDHDLYIPMTFVGYLTYLITSVAWVIRRDVYKVAHVSRRNSNSMGPHSLPAE